MSSRVLRSQAKRLLTLPPEVLRHCLLPFLEWNDLLRLRRVSTSAKALVHDYVKVNPQLVPEIEIRDKRSERNVKAFLDLNLPSAKIYLKNDYNGSAFYQENSEELSQFLEVYGSVVTHLRVEQFFLYCSGMERKFLEGLVNLQSFEAEWFDSVKVAGVNVDMMFPMPQVFGNVTVLKLRRHGDGTDKGKYRSADDGINGLIKLLTACRMLEHVRPLSLLITRESSTEIIRFLDAAIQQRKDYPEVATLSKLKVIDFDNETLWLDNVREDENRATIQAQFLRTCAVHEILLQGVRPMDSGECVKTFAMNRGELLMPFQSLILSTDKPYNWIWMMETEMPALEKVLFRIYRLGAEDIRRDNDRIVSRRANWPMLKTLKMIVSIAPWINGRPKMDEDYIRYILREMRDLFRLLFEGISRTALRELKLTFHGEVRVGNDILNAECLTTSCPNLTKLELINWGGNNEQFVRLWQGLSNLEEVILRRCSGLGIDGFIGPDAQNPAFFNLKRLRKLALYKINWMPGTMETLFSSVIRDLNLTHFTITSPRRNPLDPLEEKCLKLLLGGQFEKSIQKFSFELHDSFGLSSYGFKVRENIQKIFALRLSNML